MHQNTNFLHEFHMHSVCNVHVFEFLLRQTSQKLTKTYHCMTYELDLMHDIWNQATKFLWIWTMANANFPLQFNLIIKSTYWVNKFKLEICKFYAAHLNWKLDWMSGWVFEIMCTCSPCPVRPCNRILGISFSIYEFGYQGLCRNQNGTFNKK